MAFVRRFIYFGGAAIDLAKVMIILAIVVVLVYFFIGTIFIVSGESMVPTFQDGEVVWSNKIGYLTGKPKRGDSVVVLYPGDPGNKKYIKRAIGLPNETVTIKDGKVYIKNSSNQPVPDNQPLLEAYLDSSVVTEPDGSWNLKSNEYFLMGDNRPNSNDSRYFGPVEQRFIFGHATLILWPKLKGVE